MSSSPISRRSIGIALLVVGMAGFLLSFLLSDPLSAPDAGEEGNPPVIRETIIAQASLTAESAAITAPPMNTSTAPATIPADQPAPELQPTGSPTPAAATPSSNVTEVAATETATEEPSSAPPVEQVALVTAVLTGDTIQVRLDGTDVTVRYLGVKAPALDEPCGMEAAEANANLVLPLEVRLVPDQTDRDEEGRLLRYVFVGPVMVNAGLLSDGWVIAAPEPPDTTYADDFAALAEIAAESGRGCYSLP